MKLKVFNTFTSIVTTQFKAAEAVSYIKHKKGYNYMDSNSGVVVAESL